MARILLDTFGYSPFRRGHPGIAREIQEAEQIIITPVILRELYSGFLRGSRTAKNRSDLRTFLSSPRVRIVDVDAETSERYALIVAGLRKAGTPIPTIDIWIAASAMQQGLKVVTTDEHYAKVPQVLVALYVS